MEILEEDVRACTYGMLVSQSSGFSSALDGFRRSYCLLLIPLASVDCILTGNWALTVFEIGLASGSG